MAEVLSNLCFFKKKKKILAKIYFQRFMYVSFVSVKSNYCVQSHIENIILAKKNNFVLTSHTQKAICIYIYNLNLNIYTYIYIYIYIDTSMRMAGTRDVKQGQPSTS